MPGVGHVGRARRKGSDGRRSAHGCGLPTTRLARPSQKKKTDALFFRWTPRRGNRPRRHPPPRAADRLRVSRLTIAKRIVERRHEDAADGVDDQRTLAALGVDPAPRRGRASPFGKIRRANEPRRARSMNNQRLALIPGMIAERDGIGAGVDEFLVDRLGDGRSHRRRFSAIDHDEIERPSRGSCRADAPRMAARPRPCRPRHRRKRMRKS